MIFPVDRDLDIITLGRAGLDFSSSEPGKDFSEVKLFEKYVGGSPALIAIAAAKRGAKTGFIGKLSKDMLGSYVVSYFQSLGIDTSGIVWDEEGSGRVSLAVTETKPQLCGSIIYRNNAADILLDISDIQESYLKRAKIFVLSGTALSSSPSREAALYALRLARKNGLIVVFDLDYRPYSWRSQGEAALYYLAAAEQAHIVIGNAEEFQVILSLTGGSAPEYIDSLLEGCTETIILKKGKEGSRIFVKGAAPKNGDVYKLDRFLKPHGAGDAFAGNFLYELLHGAPIDYAVNRGAAAAAIVVSRTGCSDACPTTEELETFIADYQNGGRYA